MDLFVGRTVPQRDIVNLELLGRSLPLGILTRGALPIVEYVLDPLDILFEGLEA